MDPITIAAGASAIGGLAQLYQSEKARGAQKEQLKQIEDLYNSIKPPNYDLKISDPPELHKETLAQPQFSSSQSAPQFNLDKLNPQQYKQLANFVPEVAPYVAEKAPQTLQQSGDMKTGREAQLNALKQFMSIGAGQYDPQYQQAVEQAGRQAQSQAQSRQQSLLQDYARRGQGNSGVAIAAQLGAASSAMDRNANTNLQAASQAYQNKLQALSQGANLGAQISNQDLGMQKSNADIINAFNQRMSASQQNYQNQRSNSLNNANMYNNQTAQGLANQNVSAANQAAQSDQARQDALSKFNAQFATQERNRQDQLAQQGYQNNVNERNYQNQLATQQANWNDQQKKYANSLLSQQYNDQISRANGMTGLKQQSINANLGATADRNQAVQGVLNAGMIYGMGQQAQGNNRANNLAKSDQSFYQNNGRYMNDQEKQAYNDRLDSYNDYY